VELLLTQKAFKREGSKWTYSNKCCRK